MTKRRMIHDCLWQSEGFAELTMQQRLLWIGLITTADDQGRGKAHPGFVRASIFPLDVISQQEIIDDMQAIIDAGMMKVYEVDGKSYYQIINWWEYQKPAWASPSDYPAPDEWEDRFRYHAEGRKIITKAWPGTDDSLPSPLRSQLPNTQEEVEEEVEVKEKDNSAHAPSPASQILEAWIELFPNKPKHRLTDKLKRQAATRMKSKDFATDWRKSLEHAAKSVVCLEGDWFNLYWFLKNDDGWREILLGKYDFKNEHKKSERIRITS